MSYALLKPTALVTLMSLVAAYGCGSDNSDSGTSTEEATAGNAGEAGSAGSAGSSSGTGGSHAGTGGTGFLFDSGMAGGTGGGGGVSPDGACAAESRAAEKVPVDLYFMVDISGSMNCPVGPSGATCEVDPGPPYAAQTRWTEERAALKAFFASAQSSGLGAGIAFFPKNTASGQLACNASDYAAPSVEIGALPGAATALGAMIDQQRPGGNTPTHPSLQGAIQHAAEWAQNNSGHTVAVVYATDGYPRGCGSSNSISNAAQAAAQALQASPSIRTYVLGVGPNLTDLNQIAVSGGTNQAYFVDTGQDVGAQLTAALASIRTSVTLECTYNVPEPPAGQQLDYGKVNVRYTNGAGDQNDLPRDPSTSDCVEGWQYSADRKQIVLCGGTCDAVKNDPDGKIDILLGCSTIVGPPR